MKCVQIIEMIVGLRFALVKNTFICVYVCAGGGSRRVCEYLYPVTTCERNILILGVSVKSYLLAVLQSIVPNLSRIIRCQAPCTKYRHHHCLAVGCWLPVPLLSRLPKPMSRRIAGLTCRESAEGCALPLLLQEVRRASPYNPSHVDKDRRRMLPLLCILIVIPKHEGRQSHRL